MSTGNLGPAANAIRLEWTFGFNKEISGGVHNLSDSTRRAIFYVAGNVGVITDLDTQEQVLLQGHCNMIGCSCVSSDKTWLVTADHGGDDSMIVVWNSFAGTPQTTIPQPQGVLAVDFSPDAKYLATVSKDSPQTFSLWDWQASPEEQLLFQEEVPCSDMQHHCRFNPFEPHEIVTNGQKEVVFWSWEENGALNCSCPPLASKAGFQQTVANLTQTIYIHDSVRAISATETGDVVVWDEAFLGDYSVQRERKAMKVLKLCNAKITFLCNLEKCLVVGDTQGRVKFFDSMFRSILWFDDIHAGPVCSISFAQGLHTATRDLPGSTEEITIPQFVIATTAAKIVEVNADVFDELEPNNRNGVNLVDGFSGSIQGIAAHPSKHQVALTGYTGDILIWDYKTKTITQTRSLDKMMGNCIAYNRTGTLLAVGSTAGAVKIMDADTLVEIAGATDTFKWANECITRLVFSEDSSLLAAADSGHNVLLFKWQPPSEGDKDELPPVVWEYIGRARAHSKPITGLTFKTEKNRVRLVSLGEDRMLVEYEVEGSTIVEGVGILAQTKVEQTAVASSMVWDAHFGTPESIVLATDQYKFKFVQTSDLACVKTVLAPTFGGPINRMLHVPAFDGGQGNCLAYSTKQKVIGLVQFPLDGNPNKTMGIIAHAGEISDMAVSYDGRYIITAGRDDYCVNVWSAHPASLEKMRRLGGEGIEPFNAMIDGGKEGEFYQEMIDYFYYAQIKAQGEDTTAPRKITGLVPMEQVPDLLRALGVYPSQWDIQDILNEIQAMGDEDNPKTAINFEEFVKLYVNTRPVIGIGKEKILDAFRALGAEAGSGVISRQLLTDMLTQFGENFDEAELGSVLEELVGMSSLLEDPAEKNISAQEFAENVLGFEDYE
eukprot:TRINITY_DN7525_c0_g1_i1.p1 TRINITY_DN7525_c0_g1~~TRINITY_DN7525_c0_g1_i1.p1  ORF type:complete len:888 (-),score=271.02 TRINITY_DN7525_c0_g1_i1:169-2832(-)